MAVSSFGSVGERIPSSYANFWAADRVCVHPRRSRRRRSGIGDGGAAAEDITGRERRMNICKLQRATPSGGSRIGDQSQERRERDGKKRSGDHHDARPSSQLASTFGQTREICIKADDAGEERGRGRRCENSNLGGMSLREPFHPLDSDLGIPLSHSRPLCSN